MTPSFLALLAFVGFVAGFVDAIAGGGGLVTVPALALAGLDPVAVVATNKLAGTFGSGSATFAFCASRQDRSEDDGRVRRSPRSSAPWRARSRCPMRRARRWRSRCPFVLVAVALYFALAPQWARPQRKERLSPRLYALTLAPTIGFYDGVFGPGSGTFYMVGSSGAVRASA